MRVARDHRVEPARLRLEKLLHRRARRVDVLDQPVPVEMQPGVHDRADRRQTDRAAEIAHQIIKPGGVLHPVLRQRAQCDHVGRHDRKELETYWKDMPPTFMGFGVKLHTVYRPFELLEGEGPVEGVVVAEFPSMEEAKRWYDSPGYVAVRQHRMRGAKYLGLLVDGGVTESIDERMPQTRRKS